MSEDAPAYGPAKTCRHCGAPMDLTPLPELRWAVRVHASNRVCAIFIDLLAAQKFSKTFWGASVEEITVAKGAP